MLPCAENHPKEVDRCQTICLEVPLNRPEGITPPPCQEIWLKGMVWPRPSLRGWDESAVRITVPAEFNNPLAWKGTGLAPVDSPRTGPLPGMPVTRKVTRSITAPALPTVRLKNAGALTATVMVRLATSRAQPGEAQPRARLPRLTKMSPALRTALPHKNFTCLGTRNT